MEQKQEQNGVIYGDGDFWWYGDIRSDGPECVTPNGFERYNMGGLKFLFIEAWGEVIANYKYPFVSNNEDYL